MDKKIKTKCTPEEWRLYLSAMRRENAMKGIEKRRANGYRKRTKAELGQTVVRRPTTMYTYREDREVFEVLAAAQKISLPVLLHQVANKLKERNAVLFPTRPPKPEPPYKMEF